MAKGDSIFQIGLLVIVGLFLYGQGLIKIPKSTATSTAVTGACPRGQVYSRGLFGDCDPNYLMDGLFQENCRCQSSVTQPANQTASNVQPVAVPEPSTAHPSQTTGSAYQPDLTSPSRCPYDSSLLYGDRRCIPAPSKEQGGYGGAIGVPATGIPLLDVINNPGGMF